MLDVVLVTTHAGTLVIGAGVGWWAARRARRGNPHE